MADPGVPGGFGGVVPLGEQGPCLRVIKGDASDEEIAALVAALAAVAAVRGGGAAPEAEPYVRGNWNEKARLMRSPVHPAAGGWRRSALP